MKKDVKIVLETAEDFATGSRLYKLTRTTRKDGARTKTEYAAPANIEWRNLKEGDPAEMFLTILYDNRNDHTLGSDAKHGTL